MPPSRPVFDDHFHLDPRGERAKAVREFAKAGGTHVMVVHKPYGESPRFNRTVEDHAEDMATTLRLADEVRSEVPEVTVFVALAPHPAEFTKMLEAGYPMEEAKAVYRGGLEVAARHVREGRAVAMAEVGRPHWSPVDPVVWGAANELMASAFELARDAGCAVQIHAESATPESFADLAAHARKAGLPLGKVVKHYSTPIVDTTLNHGLWPSVLVGKEAWQRAVGDGLANAGAPKAPAAEAAEALAALDDGARRKACRMLWETDYMDDPRYPGAVLGPKTVPKRVTEFLAAGGPEEAIHVIHAENVAKVYGVAVDL